MLLNHNKGVPGVVIDECESLRQDPMNKLIHTALWFRFEIPSRGFESQERASHLNLFDTSPLQVFVQMCTMCTVCAHGELPN